VVSNTLVVVSRMRGVKSIGEASYVRRCCRPPLMTRALEVVGCPGEFIRIRNPLEEAPSGPEIDAFRPLGPAGVRDRLL
jgi:hypothetical protein